MTSKKIVLFLLTVTCLSNLSYSQDNQTYFCSVSLTNTEYDEAPLTSFRSYIFQAPAVETKYGVKVDETIKSQIRWQFFKFLYTHHRDNLSAFKGKARISSIVVVSKASEDKVTASNQHFDSSAYNEYKIIMAEDFKYEHHEFDLTSAKEHWTILNDYFVNGKEPVGL